MTEERISELRALCAEYEQKKATAEAAGLKDKAADIAADGVGRRALDALPELLDALEKERKISKRLTEFIREDFEHCPHEIDSLHLTSRCDFEEKGGCWPCWIRAAEKSIEEE